MRCTAAVCFFERNFSCDDTGYRKVTMAQSGRLQPDNAALSTKADDVAAAA